jgi:hypothetical protein
MPVTGNTFRTVAVRLALRLPPVAGARQHSIKFIANQLFDEPAYPLTYATLDRIKPVIEQMHSRLACRL